jgi:putative transposase
MPRRPRLELPGVPLHVTHRGVNRAAVFIDDHDFMAYADSLQACFAREDVSMHAYVLMTNHVHLLVSAEKQGAVSRALSRHGQRYVPAFNRRHGRTGTLWEGRFRSCLVESETYLLTLYRYIELNPVRAALVDRPDAYRWSSIHANLGGAADTLVTPHPVFADFAREPNAYREWLAEGIPDDELQAIRRYIGQERALGSERFQAMVAKTLNRPVVVRARGRPRAQRPGEFKR